MRSVAVLWVAQRAQQAGEVREDEAVAAVPYSSHSVVAV